MIIIATPSWESLKTDWWITGRCEISKSPIDVYIYRAIAFSDASLLLSSRLVEVRQYLHGLIVKREFRLEQKRLTDSYW